MSDLWTGITRDIMRRLNEHAPGMPFEDRVRIAEDAAREVGQMVTAFALPATPPENREEQNNG